MRRFLSACGALALLATLLAAPAAAAAAPTVTGTQGSPSNSGVAQITVVGTGFFASGNTVPQISISKAGRTVQFTDEELLSSTQVTGKVNLAGEQPGFWSVRVTNPDGKSGTFGNGSTTGLQVIAVRPTVESVVPATGPAGTNNYVVELEGLNFARGATIQFLDDDNLKDDITVVSTQYLSTTRYRVTIDIPPTGSLPLGGVAENHRVRMINGLTSSCSGSCAFTVSGTAAGTLDALTSISPTTGANTAPINVTIKGREFDAGEMVVHLIRGTNTIVATVNSVTDELNPLSDDTIHATLDLDGGNGVGPAGPGTYDLFVRNKAANKQRTLSNAFTVGAVAPTVTKVEPNRVLHGVDTTITITGTNFARGDVIDLGAAGVVDTVMVESPTKITAVARGSKSKADRFDVTVRHTDGQFGRCPECLSILPAGPGWLLSHDLNDGAEIAFTRGQAGDRFLSCDWDRDGLNEPVTWRNGTWAMFSAPTDSTPDLVFAFGRNPGDIPVCGDWNGDGRDTVGAVRRVGNSIEWIQRNTNTAGTAHNRFRFGTWPRIPVVGDWDGDGDDTPGVYDPATKKWALRNHNSAGTSNRRLTFATRTGDLPVVGDWDGDGDDTPGARRADGFILNNTFTSNHVSHRYELGPDGGVPIAGKWKVGAKSDRPGVVVP